MGTIDKLQTIKTKIQNLGDENTRLKTELARLNVERDVMKRKIEDHEKTIETLESKNVNLQIAKPGGSDPTSGDLLRKKIDRYIKEIDKCIELLNS